MRWNHLYVVAPNTLGLVVDKLSLWLVQLVQVLEPDQAVRSDGSAAPVTRTPADLRLLPASAVLSPAVVFPSWMPPEIVTNPGPLEPTPHDA